MLLIACAACGSSAKPHAAPATTTTRATSTTTSISTTTTSTTTTTKPSASPPVVTEPHGRVAIPSTVAPPRYSPEVSNVTAAELGASYHAGCPVGPERLRRVRLPYRGFDGSTHSGTLIVNADAVDAIVGAFRALYLARFPIRRMVPVDYYGGDDHASQRPIIDQSA